MLFCFELSYFCCQKRDTWSFFDDLIKVVQAEVVHLEKVKHGILCALVYALPRQDLLLTSACKALLSYANQVRQKALETTVNEQERTEKALESQSEKAFQEIMIELEQQGRMRDRSNQPKKQRKGKKGRTKQKKHQHQSQTKKKQQSDSQLQTVLALPLYDDQLSRSQQSGPERKSTHTNSPRLKNIVPNVDVGYLSDFDEKGFHATAMKLETSDMLDLEEWEFPKSRSCSKKQRAITKGDVYASYPIGTCALAPFRPQESNELAKLELGTRHQVDRGTQDHETPSHEPSKHSQLVTAQTSVSVSPSTTSDCGYHSSNQHRTLHTNNLSSLSTMTSPISDQINNVNNHVPASPSTKNCSISIPKIKDKLAQFHETIPAQKTANLPKSEITKQKLPSHTVAPQEKSVIFKGQSSSQVVPDNIFFGFDDLNPLSYKQNHRKLKNPNSQVQLQDSAVAQDDKQTKLLNSDDEATTLKVTEEDRKQSQHDNREETNSPNIEQKSQSINHQNFQKIDHEQVVCSDVDPHIFTHDNKQQHVRDTSVVSPTIAGQAGIFKEEGGATYHPIQDECITNTSKNILFTRSHQSQKDHARQLSKREHQLVQPAGEQFQQQDYSERHQHFSSGIHYPHPMSIPHHMFLQRPLLPYYDTHYHSSIHESMFPGLMPLSGIPPMAVIPPTTPFGSPQIIANPFQSPFYQGKQSYNFKNLNTAPNN